MMSHDVILHKQGPLSRVWIAAHWDRKLSKSQLLQTSIPSSIDVLVGDGDEAPMTLRISGQLLLGLARIYSRKAKYLQDDCSDALLRIKVAFRGTAVVDLSHEQLHGARAAITLPDVYTPMDLLLPEPTLDQWGVRPTAHPRQLARPADITLPDAHWAMDELPPLGPPSEALGDVSTTGFDLGLVDDSPRRSRPRAPPTKRVRHDTHRDTTQHTLPMDEAPGADDSLASIGVARHAAPTGGAAEHVHALVGDLDLSADLSLEPLPDLSAAAPLDMPPLPERYGGTPPPLLPDMRSSPAPGRRDLTLDDVAHAQLTPQTAAKLRTAAEQRAAEAAPRSTRKRPIQDDVTEMYPARARSLQARAAQVAATLAPATHQQHCLPASRVQLALLAAQARGAQPVLARGLGMTWGAIVHDLPALGPTASDARRAMLARNAVSPQDEMQAWLQRLHEQTQALRMGDEFPLEVGRRASVAPAWLEPPPMPEVEMAKPMDDSFDISHATEAPLDTTEPAMDLPDMDMSMPEADADAAPSPAPRRSSRHRRSSVDVTGRPAPLERMPSPELDTADVLVDVPPAYPLQAFDSRAPDTTDTDAVHVRTRRAAHVLRTTMASERISFHGLDAQATRRAAAGFFFELLALGTRDCVRLHQAHAYGDIHIEAKPALYDL